METLLRCLIFSFVAILSSSPTEAATVPQNYSSTTNSSYIHKNGTEDGVLSVEDKIVLTLIGTVDFDELASNSSGEMIMVKEFPDSVVNGTLGRSNGTGSVVRSKRAVKGETVRPKRNFRRNPVLQG